ncbi:late secretory pathway protein avl9 [Lobulomyces angularis]|nr:late secretory pathway protein avl9 [Lobulomyces angularis]
MDLNETHNEKLNTSDNNDLEELKDQLNCLETNTKSQTKKALTSPILHVLLVAFHHRNGPQVEYAIPEFPAVIEKEEVTTKHTRTVSNSSTTTNSLPAVNLPEEWSFMPFICLPDGAHATTEEFIYFHLPPVPYWDDIYQTTVFGLACYRQIPANELINKTADITRSTVQKAVVVLATQPMLGSVRSKLGMVTEALFQQKDFSKVDILESLFDNLQQMNPHPKSGIIPDSSLFMGISLRDLVYKYRHKTLQLFKVLLLGKRILFFGHSVEKLTCYQYSLVSLITDLLRNLKDVGSPLLEFQGQCNVQQKKPQVKETRGSVELLNLGLDPYKAKIEKFNLPLSIFGIGSVWLPYIPLQQIDVLLSPETKGFLVGTSNQIFTNYTALRLDVIVNTDTGAVDFNDATLAAALTLTPADKRFIEEISSAVVKSWIVGDASHDPSFMSEIEFEGSDDDIRSRFEMYLLSLLVSSKAMQETVGSTTSPVNPSVDAKATINSAPRVAKDLFVDYNPAFIKLWHNSSSYKSWNESTSIASLKEGIPNGGYPISPGHPYQGTSAISAVQLSIAARFSEFSKQISGATNSPQSIQMQTAVSNYGGKVMNSAEQLSKSVVNVINDPASQQKLKTDLEAGANQLFTGITGWYNQKRKEWSETAAVPNASDEEKNPYKSESLEDIDLLDDSKC